MKFFNKQSFLFVPVALCALGMMSFPSYSLDKQASVQKNTKGKLAEIVNSNFVSSKNKALDGSVAALMVVILGAMHARDLADHPKKMIPHKVQMPGDHTRFSR